MGPSILQSKLARASTRTREITDSYHRPRLIGKQRLQNPEPLIESHDLEMCEQRWDRVLEFFLGQEPLWIHDVRLASPDKYDGKHRKYKNDDPDEEDRPKQGPQREEEHLHHEPQIGEHGQHAQHPNRS